MSKSQNKSFTVLLKETVADFVKHPKKLLPAIILTVFWIAFSILSAEGVNIPILRFLYALTYANGGMFGGFFGAVGGIFGKAVFAAIVNGLVLSVCAKKNPFKGIKKSLPVVFGGGARAIAPFLLGGGVGILLYLFFNITSSAQNCAIAVAAAIAGIKALASQNGLLFSGVFWLLGRLSMGKTPSGATVSRILAGLTAGFAISFPITFIRFPIIMAVLGILLTAAGIIIIVIGKPKAAVAVLCLILMLPVFIPSVYAENDSFSFIIDPYYKNNKDTFGYHYTDWDAWMYYSFYKAGEVKVERNSDGKRSFSLPEYSYSFEYDGGTYSVSIPEILFTENSASDKKVVFTAEIGSGISTDYVYSKNGKESVYIHEMQSFELELSFTDKNTDDNGLEAYSSGSKCVRRSYPKGTENPDNYTYWSNTASHFSQGFTVYGYNLGSGSGSGTDESGAGDGVEYIPYRGRLTYTNGRLNKYGQPFPDLMDFDGDGEITWLDVNIQKELSHDPDWLDRPMSKSAGVFIAILTGILGAAAGTVGGAVGGAALSVAAEADFGISDAISENSGTPASDRDLGPCISRDSDGDLNVKDPVTGEIRLYKSNGDGTYTNPLTGATYSEKELKDSLDSRSDNAELLRQDEADRKAAVDAQREQNKNLSLLSKEIDEQGRNELEKAEEADRHNDYVEKLQVKYDATGKELKKAIMQEQIDAEVEGNTEMAHEAYWEAGQKTAESTEKAADVAIDVLAEVTGDEGKAIKDAYTFTKSTLVRGSEAFAEGKNVAGGMVHGAIEGSIGVMQNRAEGAGNKFAANVGGDMFKTAMESTAKGEKVDFGNVVESGGMAAIKTSVDVGFDLAGDVVKETANLSDKTVATVFETAVSSESVSNAAKAGLSDIAKDAAEKPFKIQDEDKE